MKDLAAGATLQARVIWALMIRELHTRFGRENIGFLWIMAEPAIFASGVAGIWSYTHSGGTDHSISISAFVITGYIPMVMWRSCLFRAIKAFEANGSLLFHRQVTPVDILLARVILEVYGGALAYLVVAGGATLLGYMEPPADLGLLTLGFALQTLFSLGTALVCAGLSEMSDTVERLVPAVAYLSIPFSGAFTMVDWLPSGFREVVMYSPSVNAVEVFRAGAFGPSLPTHYDIQYTVITCLVLILLGATITKLSRRHILVQ
jgi:capsular polysaccharide transport system permease protein